jgi:hypothetical protein
MAGLAPAILAMPAVGEARAMSGQAPRARLAYPPPPPSPTTRTYPREPDGSSATNWSRAAGRWISPWLSAGGVDRNGAEVCSDSRHIYGAIVGPAVIIFVALSTPARVSPVAIWRCHLARPRSRPNMVLLAKLKLRSLVSSISTRSDPPSLAQTVTTPGTHRPVSRPPPCARIASRAAGCRRQASIGGPGRPVPRRVASTVTLFVIDGAA